MKTKSTPMNHEMHGNSPFMKCLEEAAKVWLLFLALFIFASTASAATVIVKDADLTTGTYSWTNNNVYLLDGFVFLEAGGVLNIQEGTVIKAKASPTTGDNASALIITVGAKINAIGTAAQPIIFTSEADDVTDNSDLIGTDRGLWGGLILLGDGILGNATATSNVEGIPTSETRAGFGGSNNANNAGTLRYVSIRHGGAELSPGNEINGLTLGGVGSGTTIEHVEVFANSDDGIEFFGGAVNIKYATVAFCGDDAFDWDMGWVGKGQFWFVLQGSDAGDAGGEWDGAIPDANAVFSNPTIYNLTFIGSGSGAAAANTNAILMRDATAGTVANGIFTDYAHKALEIEDLPASKGIDSYTRLQNGDLKILNNIWYGFGSYTTFDAHPTTGVIRFTSKGDDTTCAALISHLTTNANQMTNPMLGGIGRSTNGQLDPRPSGSGPAMNNLAAYPSDGFFTTVNYKGAFDVIGTYPWVLGWTALHEYGYLDPSTSIDDLSAQLGRSMNLFPNPATDIIFIEYSGDAGEAITLEVYDIHGKRIGGIENRFGEGNRRAAWNTGGLSSGLYLLKTSTSSASYTQRFVVR